MNTPLFARGGKFEPPTKFPKRRRGLEGTSTCREGLMGKRDVTFFLYKGGGCSFWIENIQKSEVFNDKKSLYTKTVITKN